MHRRSVTYLVHETTTHAYPSWGTVLSESAHNSTGADGTNDNPKNENRYKLHNEKFNNKERKRILLICFGL